MEGVPGEVDQDGIEAMLAAQPHIEVPTIVLQGNDDGVDPPAAEDFERSHFTGRYERKIIEGIGHNLPQEAPRDFVAAMLALAGRPTSWAVKRQGIIPPNS